MSNNVIIQNKTNSMQEVDANRDLIKRTICKGCTDEEIELFSHACKRTGLDPFLKQIYAIKRGNQMTIQTGIDGLRLIAERTGKYSPGKEALFTYDEKGTLISSTAYIKKMTTDGSWHEVAAVAYLEEYNAKQGLWNRMPRAMLSKCAESLALRRAFPSEMSGVYSKEEMEQAGEPLEEPEMKVKNKISSTEPDILHSTVTVKLTEVQLTNLENLEKILNDKAFMSSMMSHLNIDHIKKISGKDYDSVIKWMSKKIREKQEVVEVEEVAYAG